MSLLIIPVTVVILYFSKELLLIWTGDPILVENARFACTMLILGACFNALYSIPQSFQTANHWTSLTISMQSATLAICVVLLTLAAQFGGLLGAVIVWPLIQLGYLALYIHRMHRRLLPQEKKKWLWQDVLMPACGAVVICGICRLCFSTLINGISGLLLLAAIGILTMGASAWMSGIIRNELKAKLPRFFPASTRIND